MDLDKIKQLIEIVEASSLLEFSIESGETKISMSRKGEQASVANITPSVAENDGEIIEEEFYITSPIVGTFYSASGPTIPAYVRVGDKVKKGETVCIVEAMKLMNEIPTSYDCEIEAILVSNEQKVEYGQPLFRVRKLS